MRVTAAALVVVSVFVVVGMVVVGMVEVTKPRNVDMGPSVVVAGLVFAALSMCMCMCMWHRCQLASEVSKNQHNRETATQHDPLGEGA